MQKVWKDFNLQQQFENDEFPVAFRVNVTSAIMTLVPRLAQKIIDEPFMPLQCYIENLYVRTVHNFGFSGDEMGLPVEVAMVLFEFFLFFKDFESKHLIGLIVHMLEMKLDYILTLDSMALFRYVSNGCFITDVVMNSDDYTRLFSEIVLSEFDDLVGFKK